MNSFLFGLIVLFTAIAGTLVTFFYIIVATVKRSRGYVTKVFYSFSISTIVVICLILTHEFILYPPNPKLDELVLSAYREAPLGGVWLGLYKDDRWEIGYSSSEITSEGKYHINGDTLFLLAKEGSKIVGNRNSTRFIFKSNWLVEVESSGIKALEIQVNMLNK